MIEKKTDSKKKFVKKELYPIVDYVVKKLGGSEFKKIIFLFTEKPKESFLKIANPEKMYHGRRYDKMEYWLSESLSSFSVSEGEKVTILINIKDPNIRKPGYARGLLAHEYMHTILKSRGIEPRISKVGKKEWPFIIKTIQKIGKDYERVLSDLVRMVTFCILCMKDIMVDTILIERGFMDDVLAEKSVASESVDKKIKIRKETLSNIMILYMGFHSMWIPLEIKDPSMKPKQPFKLEENVEKELSKIVKELKDVRPGASNNEKEISEVIRTCLNSYKKLYKKL